nr:hypothetical protein [Microcoleus sp. LEGE 07076]
MQEQLLLQDAKASVGKRIQGSADKLLGDASRLVANYGGEVGDWVKMLSVQIAVIEGAVVEVHWFRNNETAQTVEFKFKRTYPKAVSKTL